MGPTFDRLGMRASQPRARSRPQSRTAEHGGQLITNRSSGRKEGRGAPSLRRFDDAANHDAGGREGEREGRGRLCNIRERRKG